jgi:hypothetical protein
VAARILSLLSLIFCGCKSTQAQEEYSIVMLAVIVVLIVVLLVVVVLLFWDQELAGISKSSGSVYLYPTYNIQLTIIIKDNGF